MMARLATASDSEASEPRITTMSNETLQRKIDDARIEGWSLESEQTNRAVMVRRSYGSLGGHILVFLLTVWFTLGLGNVAYAAHVYFNRAEKKVLRADADEDDD